MRDILAHGAAAPHSLPMQLVDAAVATFIAMCLKYDVNNVEGALGGSSSPSFQERSREEARSGRTDVRTHARNDRPYAFSLECDTITRSYLFVKDYQPAYHPRARLKEHMKRCYENLVRLKAVDARIQRSPLPNGLRQPPSITTTASKETFSFERVQEEASRLAQHLQDAIIERYGGLCFFPAGFLPVDPVRKPGGSNHDDDEEKQETGPGDMPYHVTAHFALGERSKVEILCALADQVSAFLNEVRVLCDSRPSSS